MGKTHQYLQPRRERAMERQAAYAELSLKEKIALLDARLGKGQGAKKQRAKLARKFIASIPDPGTGVLATTEKALKKKTKRA